MRLRGLLVVSLVSLAVLALAATIGCSSPAAAPTPTKAAAAQPAATTAAAPAAATSAPAAPAATKPAAAATPAAQAPKYPTKAVEIIVGYAAGGGQDTVARTIAAYAQEKWKVPVTVSNKPGGGGWIGSTAAFQAAPDGYTLLVNGPTSYYSLAVAKTPPYKITDGTNIARIVINPLVFAVKGDSPFNTVKDAVEAARKSPDNFKGSGSGLAGLTSFGGAKLWIQAGIDPSKLPVMVFDSGVLSNQAVAAGNADYSVNNLVEGMALWQAKKLKFLAVTTPQRFPETPDIPTGKEAGYDQFDVLGFSGIFGPTNVPEHVITAWEGLVKEACQDPKFLDTLQKAGYVAGYQNSKDFRQYIMDTYNWAADLGKKLKIEL